MRRLHRPIGLTLLGLVVCLSGCASLPFGGSDGFDASEQAAQIRRQQKIQSSADANTAAPEPIPLKARLRRGDELRGQGEYAGAMWNYLRAHELDPDDPAPFSRIASLQLLSDPRKAESLFRELLELHPDSGAAHTGLGLALIERHDWAGAREALTRGVEQSPSSAAAHSALGVCLDRLGLYEDARLSYMRAIDLHPNYYEALNNLGVSYLTTEDFDAAEKALRRASRQENRDPAVFNNLGLALGRLGRYDDALEVFLRVGSEQVARNNLGYVHYLNGSYDQALEEYERALLAGGDHRLMVLRNLQAARRAEKGQVGPAAAKD